MEKSFVGNDRFISDLTAAVWRHSTPQNSQTPANENLTPDGIPIINVYGDVYGKNSVVNKGRNGRAVKHSHPVYAVIIVLGVLVFAAFNVKVTAAQGVRYAENVRAVAACESKDARTVHAEFHKKYNVRNYAELDMLDYYRAMGQLSSRRCDNK